MTILDYHRDLDRYDRDVATARIGANLTSLIGVAVSVCGIANRIEADATKTTLALWERKELESQAAKLETAAGLLRKAAQHAVARHLEAAE